MLSKIQPIARVICQNITGRFIHNPSARRTMKSGIRFSKTAKELPKVVASKDYSEPNSSWSQEMMKLYEQYIEKTKDGSWKKLPSYNRFLVLNEDGHFIDKFPPSKARLFTRNTEEEGSMFEYVVFANKVEKKAVGLFQSGDLLEGPSGFVHGGAIATIVDAVSGTLATYVAGFVMTASLNLDYKNPIPLGSTVIIECQLEKKEERKSYVNTRVISHDCTKLHTESTALFVSVNQKNPYQG
ncbi:acyl-coenzyme A thioesterase THEM4 [Erpetoichthys calabaricus]|uniref:Acyl-coenzyme A thioesterase THEM4 n=1 Tax=Erpetoichthys calabaricus TaxID=27687 RepID=A0A8C4S0Y4_ERPCA|nr:acyl-coenzyme A thioesterase THEM4 [Erpetoichthys calabaricus]